MTFNPSKGVPNPFKGGHEPSPMDGLEAPMPETPSNAVTHLGDWEAPMYTLTRQATTCWEGLGCHFHGARNRYRWRSIYVPKEGMTKGELLSRFLMAKSAMRSVETFLLSWSTSNGIQSYIKGMTLGLIGSALASCRRFSPSSLKFAMGLIISSLPEPFRSILSAALSGGGNKAGSFIAALNKIKRWQPKADLAERRSKWAIREFKSGRIASFLASNPLISLPNVLRAASTMVSDPTESREARKNASELLKNYGYYVEPDILEALDTVQALQNKQKKSSNPWKGRLGDTPAT